MFKKVCSFLLLLCFLSACGTSQRVQKGPVRPKSFVTPWEYYSKSRPADFTAKDSARVQRVKQVHSTGEDTKSDKTQYIIIGVVVGVVVLGGTVAGILLTR